MTNKITLNDRINAIENAYWDGAEVTEDDFMFLIERARKSIAKAHKSDKPTKAQIAYQAELAELKEYVVNKGIVTCKDVEANFNVSNQKASRMLKDCEGLIKTPAKGKVKATWTVA